MRTPTAASTPYQQPSNLAGFDRLEAQAVTGQDIVCPESVNYGSDPNSCHILGNLTVRPCCAASRVVLPCHRLHESLPQPQEQAGKAG